MTGISGSGETAATTRATGDEAQVVAVRGYLIGLQERITSAIAALDGAAFAVDAWEKAPGEPLQGRGITMILEGGKVFERAGCGFSQVRGPRLPPSATQHRPELAGAPFEAMGVSLVFHPRNPYVPAVHMNVRMLAATGNDGERVCWFGGGRRGPRTCEKPQPARSNTFPPSRIIVIPRPCRGSPGAFSQASTANAAPSNAAMAEVMRSCRPMR